MDMLPDYEIPLAPIGYKFEGIRMPRDGDFAVDYYGKPYVITKDREQYFVEPHAVFSKIA